MKGFAALAGRGTDQDDVPASAPVQLRLTLHVGDTGPDKPEDAVKIGADRAMPLLVRHAADGLVVLRPDAMIRDEAIQSAKGLHRSCYQRCAVRGRR